jgi:predicted Zn-ribbon and HTH transcriptional regulator
MSSTSQIDGDILVRLYAVARKLEGEGQYNVAKLARAAADSLVRSTAYPHELSSHKDELAHEVQAIANRLSDLDLDEGLLESFNSGALAIAEGRLTMLGETPHPYVCRTCGHVELDHPSINCPRCSAPPRTFQRFPPVYWLEAMDPLEATNWLGTTPDDVMRLIDGIVEDDLTREVVEGEWSIRDLLAHLRDAQGVLDFRVNLLLEEDKPPIESKAVFEWAKDGSESPETSMEIFDTYHNSRRKTLETLRRIPLEDWWREGRHEEFGTISIKQQASYFATHELTHLPQIEFLRERLQAL